MLSTVELNNQDKEKMKKKIKVANKNKNNGGSGHNFPGSYKKESFRILEAAVRRYPSKKAFLKLSQYSQKNTSGLYIC